MDSRCSSQQGYRVGGLEEGVSRGPSMGGASQAGAMWGGTGMMIHPYVGAIAGAILGGLIWGF